MRITSASDPLKILLVEDSKGDALLIKEAIKESMPDAHSLMIADRLEAALKLLSEQEFDVVLLDRSLPDAQEFDGLHNIQTMAPELPVIYLTANQDQEVAFESIEQGAQDYLYKDRIDGHAIMKALQYAILRKQFEGVLIARANFDMLTGLANRQLFESRLDMAIARMKRQDSKIAVLFLDLDGFKQINDNYGHLMGDRLLKQVAQRLKSSLRPYDTPARFGGDEYAILLEGIPDAEHGKLVAEKIIALLSEPFDISNQSISVGVSIGIVHAAANQLFGSEALIQQADSAMYKAKEKSGSALVVYDNTTELQVKRA